MSQTVPVSLTDMAGFAPDCPYCGKPSEAADGTRIYPHRPDLADKLFFICAPCGAWVGTHRSTGQPLGRLANAELRRLKQSVHAVFDPLWEAKIRRDNCTKKKARGAAYMWLADQMGIPREDCHIAMFNEDQCRKAQAICASIGKRARA